MLILCAAQGVLVLLGFVVLAAPRGIGYLVVAGLAAVAIAAIAALERIRFQRQGASTHPS